MPEIVNVTTFAAAVESTSGAYRPATDDGENRKRPGVPLAADSESRGGAKCERQPPAAASRTTVLRRGDVFTVTCSRDSTDSSVSTDSTA